MDRQEHSALSLGPVLMLGMVVSTMVLPSLSVLAADIIVDLGLSRTGFGALITSIAATTALSSQYAGNLSDRFGGRTVLLLISGGVVISVVGIAVSPGLAGLVAFGMFSGIANAGGNPASNKLIVHHLAPGSRGVTMGLKQSGVQAGYVLAGLTLPSVAFILGWRSAMLMLLVPAAVLVVAVLAVLPRVAREPGPARDASVRVLPAGVRLLAAYSLVMGAGTAIVTTFLPLFAQQEVGLTAAQAGATVSFLGATGVAARILIARWVERRKRFEPTLLLLALGAVATVGLLILAPVTAGRTLLPAVALGGVSVVAWNAVANLAAISIADPLVAGRASGRINLGFMTGFTIGPVVFGAVVDRSGSYTVGWALVAACFVVGAALMLARGPARRMLATTR
jgi:MFS family permease